MCLDILPPAMRELVTAQTPEGLDLVFAETPNQQEQMAKVREADHILCSWTPVSSSVIEAAPRLKLIQKYGIGVDKIDLDAAARHGVPVCIAAGVNAVAISETAITLMLAVYKRLCVAHNSLRDGQWLKWELRTGCYELWQKTVGLIGGGNIGRDNPLLRMDNVVATPHNGGGTVDTMKRIVVHAFDNIMRVERGEPLPAADRVNA